MQVKVQTVYPSEEERQLLERFTGYTLPGPLSWNEIITIIEKVEASGFTTEIRQHDCSIIETEKEATFLDINGYFISSAGYPAASKIEAVWRVLITFLKWYYRASTTNL